MSNLFEKALNSSIEAKPKSKGKAKLEIQVEDLHTYAALKAASKTIESLLDTMSEEINAVAIDQFLVNGKADSFNGVDGDTTASLQLRKRTSRSNLSEQEKIALDELGISTELAEEKRFYINNKYADNAELLEKVSGALEGIVPDDFLGAASPKFVTTKSSIDEAFNKIEDEGVLRDVLKILGTQAARTKFGGDHAEMLRILDKVLKG